MNKFCLVTGGAGYIGAHFCKELSKTGYTPVTFDNLSKGRRDFVKWGPLVHGDIRNANDVDWVLKKYNPETVFHFAGSIDVAESVARPDLYYDNNFIGSKTLVDTMLRNNCKSIIFSSTAATYGTPDVDCLDETCPQKPINPYGWSKLFVERLLDDYAHACGLRFAALRYFNASGVDKDGEVGEPSLEETHLIPLVIQAATGARANIKIFGTDYQTPDGSAVRDYIHVTDLATAHIKAMNHLKSGGQNLFLNLGTGSGYSVKEVIEVVRKITGANFEAVETGRRAGDPATLVACSKKATEVLGWQPEHSDLENIVKTTWQWHRKNS